MIIAHMLLLAMYHNISESETTCETKFACKAHRYMKHNWKQI